MDHQVEHHVDVSAALAKRRQPMALDESRRAQQRLSGDDGGVEAFQVADLQHPPRLPGRRNELLRLHDGLGDGFFHQDMRTRLQKGHGHLEVSRRRRDDADGIDLAEQLAVIAEMTRAELCRQGGPGLRLRVDDGVERAIGQGDIFLCVKAAQVSDADDGYSQLVHERYYARIGE